MNTYNPDYASPPGQTLREHLALLGMSHALCAALAGCSESTINALVAGDVHITPALARGLERATGIRARWWLRREYAYRSAQE